MPHLFDIRKRDKLWGEERKARQPIADLIEALGPSSGEHWLDIGAGNGYVTIPLLHMGCDVTALDMDETMIFDLIARTPDDLRGRLTTAIGQAPPLPLGDAEADAAVMVNTLHEVEDMTDLVNEIKRVLKSGGRLHIVEHRKGSGVEGPPEEDRIEPEDVMRMFSELELSSSKGMGAYHHVCFIR